MSRMFLCYDKIDFYSKNDILKYIKKEIIIYQTKSGALEFQRDLYKHTIWANLQQIADLFETDKSGISRHIKNVFKSGELVQKGTVAKIATVQTEGKRRVKRTVEYYNLDLILSVGYRVNSKTATKFRQWSTQTLRNHLIKGFTFNKKIGNVDEEVIGKIKIYLRRHFEI